MTCSQPFMFVLANESLACSGQRGILGQEPRLVAPGMTQARDCELRTLVCQAVHVSEPQCVVRSRQEGHQPRPAVCATMIH